MTPTRVLITGCRSWNCHTLASRIVPRLLSRLGMGLVLVHGDAPGVDTAFKEAAEDCGVDCEGHPARWTELGKKAGPVRNAEMIAAGAEMVIAVHRDLKSSKGTLGCVKLALKAGIPVWLLDSEDAEPRRIVEV